MTHPAPLCKTEKSAIYKILVVTSKSNYYKAGTSRRMF